MEARIQRDELQRELKRVQRDIQALEGEGELRQEEQENVSFQSTTAISQPHLHDASDELVQELLKSSAAELRKASEIGYDLNLPVPPEHETEKTMDELLQVSEQALGGLKLSAVKKGEKPNVWELSGTVEPIEFQIEFRTRQDGDRTIVGDFELKRIPNECAKEVEPLMNLARQRSCVRTWLMGISEYAFLVNEREEAFAKIRRDAPYGSCRQPERRIQNYIDTVSDDGRKCIRLVWKAEWTTIPNYNEPNEFLNPKLELLAIRGFDQTAIAAIQEPSAFAPLVRKHGVAGAMIIIIRQLFD